MKQRLTNKCFYTSFFVHPPLPLTPPPLRHIRSSLVRETHEYNEKLIFRGNVIIKWRLFQRRRDDNVEAAAAAASPFTTRTMSTVLGIIK